MPDEGVEEAPVEEEEVDAAADDDDVAFAVEEEEDDDDPWDVVLSRVVLRLDEVPGGVVVFPMGGGIALERAPAAAPGGITEEAANPGIFDLSTSDIVF